MDNVEPPPGHTAATSTDVKKILIENKTHNFCDSSGKYSFAVLFAHLQMHVNSIVKKVLPTYFALCELLNNIFPLIDTPHTFLIDIFTGMWKAD